tara:strand:+ start:1136 stop:1414 length:279 start_codon:yes stop_codon:yes gene_type:complete
MTDPLLSSGSSAAYFWQITALPAQEGRRPDWVGRSAWIYMWMLLPLVMMMVMMMVLVRVRIVSAVPMIPTRRGRGRGRECGMWNAASPLPAS